MPRKDRHSLTEEQRRQAVALYASGLSAQKVAEQVSGHPQTVARFVREVGIGRNHSQAGVIRWRSRMDGAPIGRRLAEAAQGSAARRSADWNPPTGFCPGCGEVIAYEATRCAECELQEAQTLTYHHAYPIWGGLSEKEQRELQARIDQAKREREKERARAAKRREEEARWQEQARQDREYRRCRELERRLCRHCYDTQRACFRCLTTGPRPPGREVLGCFYGDPNCATCAPLREELFRLRPPVDYRSDPPDPAPAEDPAR